MYRINPLNRNVLITVDEVIFHAPTKHQLDHRLIDQSIIVAEERIIRETLGTDLYYYLIDNKNQEVTNVNKADLEAKVNTSLPEGSDVVTLAIGDIINSFSFLTTEYQALWKQHLWKLTAECVMLSAYPEGWSQFGDAGVVHLNPVAGGLTTTSLVTPELASVKWAMDKKMMDRIDPLRESMHMWLCSKRKVDITSYTEYVKPCDCNVDGIAYKRKTDIILGAYDDIDDLHDHHNRNCNCW